MTEKERKELYKELLPILAEKDGADCKVRSLGEGMAVLEICIRGWWKPIILVDEKNKSAMWFMNPEDETLLNVPDEAIDWKSVEGLDCIERVEARWAHFPTNIRGFRHGRAEVEWQVHPDGRYFMDSSGFGMTDDEEIALIGYIDRKGNVVRPFTLKR